MKSLGPICFVFGALGILSSGCSSLGPTTTGAIPGVTVALVPKGQHGRHRIRQMRPRYITIHSTQNFGSGADAAAHAKLLQRGALKGRKNSLGYITWHYTVDDHSIYQTLPDNEQGQHADYEGPGNRYSIGIEMCENRDGSLPRTIDRTAKLTALLMHQHGIPLSRVVPHYHWPRKGTRRPHKNCPHFLMDGGKPGRKWRGFLSQVNRYYRAAGAQQVADR